MADYYETLDFLDRVTEVVIEYQLTEQARAYNFARPDEVVSYLSEHGLGDEAVPARVARAANRLVNEGVLVAKDGAYRLTERGQLKAEQAGNLLDKATGLLKEEGVAEQPF